MLHIESLDADGRLTRVAVDVRQGASVMVYATQDNGAWQSWFTPSHDSGVGCFVMVPFASRIAYGRFRFAGQTIELPANHPPEPHALHGHGHQRPWRVQEQHEDALLLTYAHAAGDWPWTYEAWLSYRLEGAQLQVSLSVENRSARAMPCGMGLHPYLPRVGSVEVQAQVGQWLALDTQGMPVARLPVPADLDLRQGLQLAERPLDEVFLDWSGSAQVHWRVGAAATDVLRGLRVHSTCPYLVLWAPAAQTYFCLEGISNLPDAFNATGREALRDAPAFDVVQPQHRLTQQWTFTPTWGAD